jgi:adenine-specific DNA-methyltransferase
MGLLQEIFAIKELIAFATNSEWEPAKVKENIIQNSIYGVDIEKGAVDIARLRFWLSLIVNEEKPKALPNLDYKIVVGDSLLSKFGEQVIDIDWDIKGNSDFQKKIKKSIEELVKAKKDFFELKKRKVNAKKDIRTKTIDLTNQYINL